MLFLHRFPLSGEQAGRRPVFLRSLSGFDPGGQLLHAVPPPLGRPAEGSRPLLQRRRFAPARLPALLQPLQGAGRFRLPGFQSGQPAQGGLLLPAGGFQEGFGGRLGFGRPSFSRLGFGRRPAGRFEGPGRSRAGVGGPNAEGGDQIALRSNRPHTGVTAADVPSRAPPLDQDHISQQRLHQRAVSGGAEPVQQRLHPPPAGGGQSGRLSPALRGENHGQASQALGFELAHRPPQTLHPLEDQSLRPDAGRRVRRRRRLAGHIQQRGEPPDHFGRPRQPFGRRRAGRPGRRFQSFRLGGRRDPRFFGRPQQAAALFPLGFSGAAGFGLGFAGLAGRRQPNAGRSELASRRFGLLLFCVQPALDLGEALRQPVCFAGAPNVRRLQRPEVAAHPGQIRFGGLNRPAGQGPHPVFGGPQGFLAGFGVAARPAFLFFGFPLLESQPVCFCFEAAPPGFGLPDAGGEAPGPLLGHPDDPPQPGFYGFQSGGRPGGLLRGPLLRLGFFPDAGGLGF